MKTQKLITLTALTLIFCLPAYAEEKKEEGSVSNTITSVAKGTTLVGATDLAVHSLQYRELNKQFEVHNKLAWDEFHQLYKDLEKVHEKVGPAETREMLAASKAYRDSTMGGRDYAPEEVTKRWEKARKAFEKATKGHPEVVAMEEKIAKHRDFLDAMRPESIQGKGGKTHTPYHKSVVDLNRQVGRNIMRGMRGAAVLGASVAAIGFLAPEPEKKKAPPVPEGFYEVQEYDSLAEDRVQRHYFPKERNDLDHDGQHDGSYYNAENDAAAEID